MACTAPAYDIAMANMVTMLGGTTMAIAPNNLTSAPPIHPRRQQTAAAMKMVRPQPRLIGSRSAVKAATMPNPAIAAGIQFGTVRDTISCQAASSSTMPLASIIVVVISEGQECNIACDIWNLGQSVVCVTETKYAAASLAAAPGRSP